MAITAKSTTTAATTDNPGTGFLLVFFPDHNSPTSASASAATSPSSSKPATKRSNSNNNLIISKTQSTLSICALLLFLSLLFFTLSTFEPNPSLKSPRRTQPTKRTLSWLNKMWPTDFSGSANVTSFALQGMGRLYLRGTRPMSDLVVAHLVEGVNEADFRLFLRALHRSGLTARSDTVLVFSSPASSSRFDAVVYEENDSFLRLVQYHNEFRNRTSRDSVLAASFDVTRFVKSGKKEMGEPLWGKRIRANVNNNNNDHNESGTSEGESTRLSYGSVVGFYASELDPENSLAGFMDHVPMSLRRWACYPMLLGRVRRNFKHIILVDVKNLVLLGDPLGRVRNRVPESVYVSTKQGTVGSSKHSKRNSEKILSHSVVNSGVLMGGIRGIRRFSSAMLTEIVRVAMQNKKKNSVTESGIFNQLVGNEHILKNINLITSTESIPDSSSLTESNSPWRDSSYSIIHRGNTNHDLNSIIMKQICACELDSSVYRDC